MNKYLKSIFVIFIISCALIFTTSVYGVDNVATVGENSYTNIEDAISELATNGGTLTLLSYVTYGSSSTAFVDITTSNAVTIDLNGKTFYMNDKGFQLNNADLIVTLKDSVGGGAIDGTTEGSAKSKQIFSVTKGKLIVDSGTIKSNSYGINLKSGQTAEIKNGVISAASYGVYINKDATLTNENGTIYGGSYAVYQLGANSTFNMSGGKLYSTKYSALYIYSTGTANITGGKIYTENVPADSATDKVTSKNYYSIYVYGDGAKLNLENTEVTGYNGIYARRNANISIKDSSVINTGARSVYLLSTSESASTLTIENSNIKSNDEYVIASFGNDTINFASGSLTGYYGVYQNNGSLTIGDVTFTASATGLYLGNNVNFTLNGGTLSAKYAIYVTGKDTVVNCNGGTVNTTGSAIYAIDGTINVDGTTIIAPRDGILLNQTESTAFPKAYIKSGTITATNEGSNSIAIEAISELDTSSNVLVDLAGGTINGSVFLVNKKDTEENVILNIKDGTVINGSAFCVTTNGTNLGRVKVNILGGTLNSDDYAIYMPQAGTINISGGNIIGAAGAVALNRGDLVVSGGTLKSLGSFVSTEDIKKDGTRGYSNTVIATSAEYGPVTVTINGKDANIIAEGNASLISDAGTYAAGLFKGATVSLSAGTYSQEPEPADIIEGLVSEKVGNNYVIGKPATSLTVTESAEVNLTDTYTIDAKVEPEDAVQIVRYSSEDETVAIVDASGKVTPKKVGKTSIIAKVGEISKKVDITVISKATDIAVDEKIELNLNDTYDLKASILPSGSTDKLTYKSEDASIAEVDENGKITAKKIGTTKIIVKAGDITKEVVTVVISKATDVTIEEKIELNVEETYELKAKVTPTDSTDKLTYEAEDLSIAKVDDKGIVTALKAGSTKIIVKAGNVTKEVITVVVKKATGLTIDNKLELTIEDTYSLKATLAPEDTTDKLSYESKDSTIAKVDEKGLVTAVKVGQTTIIAKIGDITKEVTVTVLPKEIISKVTETAKVENELVETEITEQTSEILSDSIEINEEVYEIVKEEILKGNTITTDIDIEIIEDKEKLEEVTKEIEKLLPNENINITDLLDISILVKSNGTEIAKLTELSEPIEFKIKIPEKIKKEGRTYDIVRIHDGKAEKLSAKEKDGYLIFKTNKFSYYALSYTDSETVTTTADDKTVQTSDSTVLFSVISIFVAGFVIISLQNKKRKLNNR